MGTYHAEEDAVIAFAGDSKRTDFRVRRSQTNFSEQHKPRPRKEHGAGTRMALQIED